jgi:hypothetical protein
MVLMSLGLVAALVVGGAFSARQFAKDARIAQQALELEPAAERAVVGALADLDSVNLAGMPVGEALAGDSMAVSGVSTRVWTTKLSASTVWITATASTGLKPLLRKRIAVIAVLSTSGTSRWANLTWLALP